MKRGKQGGKELTDKAMGASLLCLREGEAPLPFFSAQLGVCVEGKSGSYHCHGPAALGDNGWGLPMRKQRLTEMTSPPVHSWDSTLTPGPWQSRLFLFPSRAGPVGFQAQGESGLDGRPEQARLLLGCSPGSSLGELCVFLLGARPHQALLAGSAPRLAARSDIKQIKGLLAPLLGSRLSARAGGMRPGPRAL